MQRSVCRGLGVTVLGGTRPVATRTPAVLSWKGPENNSTNKNSTAAAPSGTSASNIAADTAHKISADKNVASNLMGGGGGDGSTSSFLDHIPKRIAYLAFVQGRKFIVPAVGIPATVAMCSSMADFGASAAFMCVAQRIVTRSLASPSLALAREKAAPVHARFAELTAKPVAPQGGEAARAQELKDLRDALPLHGQVAVVTGATGPVGGVVANELRSLGAQVYISHRAQSSSDKQVLVFHPNSRQPEEGEPQPDHILHPLTSIPLDLADRSSVRSFVLILNDLINKRCTKDQPPAVDILVHAASATQYVFGLTKAHKTDPHIEVNFTGPLLMTESLLPLIRASSSSGLPDKANRGGGRIVYVGCTSHSLIGRKYTGKEVAEGYAKEDSWIMKKYRADPDDDTSYIGNVMNSTSKLGNIYHTQSLNERRLAGINLKERASKLRPYSACCAILPSLDLPKYQFPYTGTLVKSDGDTRRDPHSYTSGWVGKLQNALMPFRTNPEQACENVLECCLSPRLVSGGMYVECHELSGCDDNAGVLRSAVSGAISFKAKDSREQKLMVGYAAELTRQYAVKLSAAGGSSPSSSSATKGN